MDRLSVMKSARHFFNGPLLKCYKTAAVNYHRASVSSYTVVRMFSVDNSHNAPSSTGSKILESPFGSVKPVDMTLPEYIWKNVEKWEDKPMIVSRPTVIIFVLILYVQLTVCIIGATRGGGLEIINLPVHPGICDL